MNDPRGPADLGGEKTPSVAYLARMPMEGDGPSRSKTGSGRTGGGGAKGAAAAPKKEPDPPKPPGRPAGDGAGAIRTVERELARIASDEAWPLPLLVTDVPGARDRADVVVAVSEPEEKEVQLGESLTRTSTTAARKIEPLATVSYEATLPSELARLIAGGDPSQVQPTLLDWARTMRGRQVHDALAELEIDTSTAPPLTEDAVAKAIAALLESGQGPVTLVLIESPPDEIAKVAAKAGATVLKAAHLKLIVGSGTSPVRAFAVSTRFVQGLRYLGHDLECAPKWSEKTGGVRTLKVTERRLLVRAAPFTGSAGTAFR